MAKEFTIIVKPGGGTTISLKGYEQESEAIAKEFEAAIGTPNKVDWNPKQHLGGVVKLHGR